MLEDRPGRYAPARMLRWLAWLARSMGERSHTELHFDRLQPDWLPTSAQQRLVPLVPAIGVGLIAGLVVGQLAGLGAGLISGLFTRMADQRPTPNEGIRRSAREALAFGLLAAPAFGLGVGLVFGLGVWFASGLTTGLIPGLFAGLTLGLAAGLVVGGAACLRQLVLRGLLAGNGLAPVRYVRFLDDATERLLLRRTGNAYLFVHRLLLEHFAGLETARRVESPDPSPRPLTAAPPPDGGPTL